MLDYSLPLESKNKVYRENGNKDSSIDIKILCVPLKLGCMFLLYECVLTGMYDYVLIQLIQY